MPVKTTPTIVKRMAEAPSELKALVDQLVNADQNDMIAKLNLLLVDWNRPRGDLCPWIPLLDKFEVLMQQMVDKYHLEDQYIPPIAVSEQDELLTSTILQFTAFLLEKCSNRGAYSSARLVNLLLRSTSTKILSQALHVCVALSYQARTRTAMASIIDADLIYQFASILPIYRNSLEDYTTLSKFISSADGGWFPEEFSSVRITYYSQQTSGSSSSAAWAGSPMSATAKSLSTTSASVSAKLSSDNSATTAMSPIVGSSSVRGAVDALNTPTKPSRTQSQQHHHTPLNNSSSNSGILIPDEPYVFSVDSETVKSHSIDALYSKACAVLPSRDWAEALKKIRLAKGCQKSKDALEIRRLLFSIQCYALGIACYTYKQETLASKLHTDPSIIVKNLCNIVSPKYLERGIKSTDVHLSLECLLCSTSHTDRRNDIITGLSALTSFGSLMSMIRHIIKCMRTNVPIDERVSTELLALVSELVTNLQIGTMLTSAGLLSALVDMLSIETATIGDNYLKTMFFAAELLDHLILEVRPTLMLFVELKGPDRIIEITNRSVKYCIGELDLNQERPPDLCNVDYKLSFFRSQWLRSLLVVLSNMLLELNLSGNLADLVGPSLFEIITNIVSNPEIFGTRIVSLSIHIVSSLLETYSGAFAVMQETGFLDSILGHFDGLLKLHHVYYGDITKVIASLFGNESGAEIVKEKRLIEKLFDGISANPEKLDSLSTVGSILNELCADNSELRPKIIKMIMSFVDKLPELVTSLSQDSHVVFIGRSKAYPSGPEGNAIIVPESRVDTYKLLSNSVALLKSATTHHVNLYELKKNVSCIKGLLQLCELECLPFDFPNTNTQYNLARMLGALFLFDLNVEEMDSIICNSLYDALSTATTNVSQAVMRIRQLEDVGNLNDDEASEMVKNLSIMSSYMLFFYEIVFLDSGTGVRAIRVMDYMLESRNGNKDIIQSIANALRLCIELDSKLTSFTDNAKLVEATSAFLDDHSSFRTTQEAVRALEVSSPGTTSSVLFERYRALRFLTSSISVNAVNIFSSVASLCFSNKSIQRDNTRAITVLGKKNGLKMADSIAKELIVILDKRPSPDSHHQSIMANRNYLINALKVISHIIVRDSGAKQAVSLPVFIFFKQYGGLRQLFAVLNTLWPLTCRDETNANDDAGDKNVAVFIVKNILIFFIQILSYEAVIVNNRKVLNFLESSAEGRGSKEFSTAQFHTECKIIVLDYLLEFFKDEIIYKTNFQISTSLIQLLHYATGPQLDTVADKSTIPMNIDWRGMDGESDERPNFEDAPISDTGKKLVSEEDLLELKDKLCDKFLSKILKIVKHNPETVLVASTFIKRRLNLPVKPRTATESGYSSQGQSCIKEAIKLCQVDLDPSTGKFCSTEEDPGIAGLLHLIGMLLGDRPKVGDQNYDDLVSCGDYLFSLLEQEDIRSRFFYPYLLMVLEKLVVFLDVPRPEELKVVGDFIHLSINPIQIAANENNYCQQLFDFISKPVAPTTDTEMISLVRLYVHYARDFQLASILVSSGCVEIVVDSIPRFSGSPLLSKITSAIVLLLRYAVETPDIVKSSMRDEIRHYFDHGEYEKFRPKNVLKSFEVLIARSPELFLEVFGEFVLFANSKSDELLITEELMDAREYQTRQKIKSLTTDGDEQNEEKMRDILRKWSCKGNTISSSDHDVKASGDEVQNKTTKVARPEKITGVVDLLLRKLFIKRPSMFVSNGSSSITGSHHMTRKLKPEDYPDFIYTCYLLRFLAELLQSYSNCKLEFIYFEKKPHHVHSKPRLYALTRLLKDFLPVTAVPATAPTVELLINDMKSTLSDLTHNVILNLMSCTYEHGSYALPQEILDQTIIYVRTCALDVFARAIREAVLFLHNNLEKKYSFLRAITELCNLMCFQENYFYKKSYIDGEQIAVMMYEKNYLNFFFHILSTLDLNHSDSGTIVRAVLKCCRKIGAVPASDVNKSAEANDHQEEVESRPEVDLFDSTPMNIFQNSSLAFYDDDGVMYDDSDDEIDAEDEGMDDVEDHMEGIEYENVTSDAYSEVDEESDENESVYDIDDDDVMEDDGYPDSYDDDSDSGSEDVDDHVELVIESYDEDTDSDLDDSADEDIDSSEDDSDDSGRHSFDQELVETVHAIRDGIYYDDQVVDYNILDLDATARNSGRERGLFYVPANRSHGGANHGGHNEPGWQENDEDEISIEGDLETIDIADIDEDDGGNDEDEVEHSMDEDDDSTGEDDEDDESLGDEHNDVIGTTFYRDSWESDGLHGYLLFRGTPRQDANSSHPLVYNGRLSELLSTPLHYRHNLAVINGGSSFYGLEAAYNIRPFELIEAPHETNPNGFTGVMSLPAYHLSSDRYFLNQFYQFHFGYQQKPNFDLLSALKNSSVFYFNRWNEAASLFKTFDSRYDILLPAISNRILERSIERGEDLEKLTLRAKQLHEEATVPEKHHESDHSDNKNSSEEESMQAENPDGDETTDEPIEEEITDMSNDTEREPVAQNEGSDEPEAVYVTIGGNEVNVAGLGIDPTFLMALPDDIREEAFTQHLRETVTTAQANGQEPRDVLDPEFLDAIPQHILNDLGLRGTSNSRGSIHSSAPSLLSFLASFEEFRHLLPEDSSGQSGLPRLSRRVVRRGNDDFDIEIENMDGIDGTDSDGTGSDGSDNGSDGALGSEPTKHKLQKSDFDTIKYFRYGDERNPWGKFTSKEKEKVHYVMDKHVVSSLMRLVFVSLTNSQRETLNHLLADLSSNRQNRIEIIKHLLNIIQAASTSPTAAESAYSLYCNRALKGAATAANNGTTPSSVSKAYSSIRHHLPQGITSSIIIRQSLIALEKIILRDASSVLLFLCENDVLNSKTDQSPDSLEKKYLLNMLLSILDCPEVRASSSTLDDLTIVLREITKPLAGLKRGVRVEDQPARAQKLLGFHIPNKNISKLAKVLTAKECNAKTFKQTLHVIHNLCCKKDLQSVLGQELVEETEILQKKILTDLQRLQESLESANGDVELQGQLLSQFSSADADQVKLLRILTAIDILFDKKKGKDDAVSSEDQETYLHQLYSQMNLGDLFITLSRCLKTIEEGQEMMPSATALLALIESLMVVCKHSAVREVNLRENVTSANEVISSNQELAQPDFSSKPLEQLFFTFTEEHRKVLNYMVRTNPRLMSGSFAILFKNPKALDFDNKRRYFYNNLKDSHRGNEKSLHVNVRRDHVFLDSYKSLHFRNPKELKESTFFVRFQGEEGIDEGGLSREWYQVLSRQMVNPDYALFTPVASDRTTFHPNRSSWVNPEHLSFFKFVGRIIGKAIFDSKVVDCHFSRAVYKRILGKPVSMKDMESLDLDYYKSLMWMLENDITDVITETFSIDTNDFGDQKTVDLKPGGRDIPVTEDNKREYVQLVINYRLLQSVEPQLNAFLEGFHDIIPEDLIAIFDEQELELLISGMPDIDVEDWRANTVYNNFSESSTIVKWFWRAVKSFDAEEQAKLLQFVTGTSKVPLNGFKALEGMNGISKFSIHKNFGEPNRLPTSHTCFNQLDLPEYDSYETLRRALLIAISEGREGFGFA